MKQPSVYVYRPIAEKFRHNITKFSTVAQDAAKAIGSDVTLTNHRRLRQNLVDPVEVSDAYMHHTDKSATPLFMKTLCQYIREAKQARPAMRRRSDARLESVEYFPSTISGSAQWLIALMPEARSRAELYAERRLCTGTIDARLPAAARPYGWDQLESGIVIAHTNHEKSAELFTAVANAMQHRISQLVLGEVSIVEADAAKYHG